MHLRNSHIIVTILLSFSSLYAKSQIAVADLEPIGVSQTEARALSNRLSAELFKTGKFIVLEREQLDEIIEEQKFQLSGCNSNECLVELGQIANVEEIVGGGISKVGDVFSVTAKLISVETGEVMQVGTYDLEGKIGHLLTMGMKSIAEQLSGLSSYAPTVNAVTSVEVKRPPMVKVRYDSNGNYSFDRSYHVQLSFDAPIRLTPSIRAKAYTRKKSGTELKIVGHVEDTNFWIIKSGLSKYYVHNAFLDENDPDYLTIKNIIGL